jgi:potassium efflux system protein
VSRAEDPGVRQSFAARLLLLLAAFVPACAAWGHGGDERSPESDRGLPPASKPGPSAWRTENPTRVEDVPSARTALALRLKELDGNAAKDRTKDAPEEPVADLKKVLSERDSHLEAWRQACADHRDAEAAALQPEQELAGLNARLEHARTQLERAKSDPDALLPDLFRPPTTRVSDVVLTEMKDAIALQLESWNDLKARISGARVNAGEKASSGPPAELAARRDDHRKTLATLASRTSEAEAALAAATTTEGRELAQQRLLVLELEGRIATERIQEVDAKIARARLEASHFEPRQKSLAAQCELAKQTLDLMRARYRLLAERQQHDLERAAATEQSRAFRISDPIGRYRARKAAQFLDLQALVLKDEQELASPPSPSPQEQAELLHRAREDFDRQKEILEKGRSTTLIATRLTNGYRRLASERLSIVNRELAQASALVNKYENVLTEVELDLINETRDDQIELEGILVQLPKARHAEMLAVFETTDQKHRTLLEARRRALETLMARAVNTREKVLERIKLLDEQRGFIRTHIFWVRDSPPLGVQTALQLPREALSLGRALLLLAAHLRPDAPRARIAPEYILAVLGVVALPWVAYRARKALRRILDRERRTAGGLVVVDTV